MIKNMTGIALVRSLVQWGISKLLASAFGVAAVTFLADELGWQIDQAWLVNGTSIFIFGLLVYVGNQFGTRFAWINKVLSLGLSRTGPAYVPNDADAVVSTATAAGSDTVTAIDTPPPGPNPEPEIWPGN